MMALLFPAPLRLEEPITLTYQQKPLLEAVADALANAPDFTAETVEKALSAALSDHGARLKDIAHVVRLITTGRKVGPGLFELLALVGRDLVLSRLQRLLKEGRA